MSTDTDIEDFEASDDENLYESDQEEESYSPVEQRRRRSLTAKDFARLQRKKTVYISSDSDSDSYYEESYEESESSEEREGYSVITSSPSDRRKGSDYETTASYNSYSSFPSESSEETKGYSVITSSPSDRRKGSDYETTASYNSHSSFPSVLNMGKKGGSTENVPATTSTSMQKKSPLPSTQKPPSSLKTADDSTTQDLPSRQNISVSMFKRTVKPTPISVSMFKKGSTTSTTTTQSVPSRDNISVSMFNRTVKPTPISVSMFKKDSSTQSLPSRQNTVVPVLREPSSTSSTHISVSMFRTVVKNNVPISVSMFKKDSSSQSLPSMHDISISMFKREVKTTPISISMFRKKTTSIPLSNSVTIKKRTAADTASIVTKTMAQYGTRYNNEVEASARIG